jgi:hypothetical protein
MIKPRVDPALEAIVAHKQRLFTQWLNDENTRKFFRALELKRIAHLTAAGRNSIRTGIENAKEHNQLVEANTILHIIETYGPGSTYPYREIDTQDSTIAAVVG